MLATIQASTKASSVACDVCRINFSRAGMQVSFLLYQTGVASGSLTFLRFPFHFLAGRAFFDACCVVDTEERLAHACSGAFGHLAVCCCLL